MERSDVSPTEPESIRSYLGNVPLLKQRRAEWYKKVSILSFAVLVRPPSSSVVPSSTPVRGMRVGGSGKGPAIGSGDASPARRIEYASLHSGSTPAGETPFLYHSHRPEGYRLVIYSLTDSIDWVKIFARLLYCLSPVSSTRRRVG